MSRHTLLSLHGRRSPSRWVSSPSWSSFAGAVAISLAVSLLSVAPPAGAAQQKCSAGARTLSSPGSRVYPDVGNGGYKSLHTDVHLTYDAASNKFLAGTYVLLRDRAQQCLTSFSLDFERHSANTSGGPDMRVGSVTVNGVAASWRFVRPTYPGDRLGADDPDPRAHQASQLDPVGGPKNNPLPPACSPEILTTSAKANSRNGTMCPANKLVITPKQHIANGSTFTVRIGYTGRPGVHNDGDVTTEGWFRSSDGGFVTTEPLGTEDWMPLNDHPSAKPTYDFYDTVPSGRVAICNGVLIGSVRHPANTQFPNGSVTWHWHAAMNIASYLVENSIGNYAFSRRTADNGTYYYTVQDQNISAPQRQANAQVIAQQEDITNYESQFNGSFPFTSDGVIVGTPSASFEEEMQTMITFAGGRTDPVTLYHENMHQWWGDNVSEASFAMTFFKEGMATLAESLFKARTAETAAGGQSSASGQTAFEQSLASTFKSVYDSSGSFWTQAPSDPTAAGLFSSSATYSRPGAAYIALRQVLGHAEFVQALRQIQRTFGGRSITESQLKRAFARWLPNPTSECRSRLSVFFREWFDTAYRSGGGTNKPQITGPGLEGTNFYGHGGCTAS